MGRLGLLLCVGVFGAATFAGASASASGGTTICNGTLAPGSYQRVVVPNDSVCLSDGPVTIRAGLFVQQGATVVLGSEENAAHTATINGGVHATNAMNVQIHFSTINGGYNEVGYDGFWNGFIRNNVHGSVNINGNTVMDPDGNEIVTNTIHGNLNCQGNDPPPQVGDSGGSPNHVTGQETGQCVGL